MIDDTWPGAEVWVTNPDEKVVLYPEDKVTINNPSGWLTDSEIYAALLLLKRQFPYIDGLQDSALVGSLVMPSTSEFV